MVEMIIQRGEDNGVWLVNIVDGSPSSGFPAKLTPKIKCLFWDPVGEITSSAILTPPLVTGQVPLCVNYAQGSIV